MRVVLINTARNAFKNKARTTNRTKTNINSLSLADQDEGLLVEKMHIFNVVPSRQSIQQVVPGSLFPCCWHLDSPPPTPPLCIPAHTVDPLSNWA